MRERLRKFITTQFSNPSGFFGRMIGSRMAKGNVYDAQWTIYLLDIQPHQRLLEIGFGPGVSTQMAGDKLSSGFIAGLDHSEMMVQVASRRNADAIRSGRMELRQGDVRSLSYPDNSFDTAFSIHSIYFWPEPLNCFREIKRVLKQGGLLAITIQPKDRWIPKVDPNVMTRYSGSQVVDMFSQAGYRNIRLETPPPKDQHSLECILGSV